MAARNFAMQLGRWVYEALVDAKAQDITALDVRKVSDFTDTMVIATGTSTRHVGAVAERVIEKLREHGRRPVGVEGTGVGDWVLIDFGDVVVHIMRAQVRDFYGLEKLWSEGKPLDLAARKPPRKAATARKTRRAPG